MHVFARMNSTPLLPFLILLMCCGNAWSEVSAGTKTDKEQSPAGGADPYRKLTDVGEWAYSLGAVVSLTPLSWLLSSTLTQFIPAYGSGSVLTEADFERMRGIVADELKKSRLKTTLSQLRSKTSDLAGFKRGNTSDAWRERSEGLRRDIAEFETLLNDLYDNSAKDENSNAQNKNESKDMKLASNYIAGARLYASAVLEMVQLQTFEGGGTSANDFMNINGIRPKLNEMGNRLTRIADWHEQNINNINVVHYGWNGRSQDIQVVIPWPGSNSNDSYLWLEDSYRFDETRNTMAGLWANDDQTIIEAYYHEENIPTRDRWLNRVLEAGIWDAGAIRAQYELSIRDYYRDEFRGIAAEARRVRDGWVLRMSNLGNFTRRDISLNEVWSNVSLSTVSGGAYTSSPGYVGTFIRGIHDWSDADVFQLAVFGKLNTQGANDAQPPFLTIGSRSYVARMGYDFVDWIGMLAHTYKATEIRPAGANLDFAIIATDNNWDNPSPYQRIRQFSIDINGSATPGATVAVQTMSVFTARYGAEPTAPQSNLSLVVPVPTVIRSGSTATLSWSSQDLSSSGSLLLIERQALGETLIKKVDLVPAAAGTWQDHGLEASKSYAYRLTHINARNDSSLTYDVGTFSHFPARWSGASVYGNSITVRWNPSTATSTAGLYQVHRRLSSQSAYTTIGSGSAASGGLMEFVDAAVSPGNTYLYRVVPVIPATTTLMSDYSSELSINMSLVPSIPGSVAAQTSNNKQVVSWLYSGPDVTSFVLRRYNAQATSYALVEQQGTARQWADSASTGQSTYRYSLRAKRLAGIIEYSSVYSAITAAPATPLPVPTGVIATPESTSISLRWAARTNTPYQVEYRIANASTWQSVTTQTVGLTGATQQISLNIAPLRAFTTYQFRLRAVGSGTTASSNWSTIVTSTTLPAPPTWSQIQVYRNSAVMSWQSVPQAVNYRIEQRNARMLFDAIGTVAATSREWRATGLSLSSTYAYRVVPLNASGVPMTSPSSVAEFNTARALDPVINLAAVANSSQVGLTWTDNNTASGRIYVIRRYDVRTGAYAFLYPPPGTGRTWQDTTAVRGIYYQYAIRPVLRIGLIDYTADYSSRSLAVTIPLSTPPATIAALTLNATTQITFDRATLNWAWTAPRGITISGFRIVVAGPGGVPTEHSLGATARILNLTGLLASSSYAVSIHALRTDGTTYQTVQGTVTTLRLTGQPSLWTMDAITNGAVIDTVLRRQAVAVGGPTIVTGPPGFGTALHLTAGQSLAVDSNTESPLASNLVNNPQVFTIAAWIKTGIMAQPRVVVGFADPNSGVNPVTRDRILGVGSDGRVFFGVFSQGALRQITSTKGVTDEKWHLIAASLDATHGMRLYVDGLLDGSNSNVKSAEPTRGRWRVGAGNLSGSWGGTVAGQFLGDIDDVRIYLSAESLDVMNAWANPFAGLYRPAMFYAN